MDPCRDSAAHSLEQAHFRAIFHSSPDAVVITDRRGVVLQASPATASVFGSPVVNVVGQQMARYIQPWQNNRAAYRQFLRDGGYRGQVKLLCGDGQVRDVELTATANVLPGQHLVICRDITDHRDSQIELSRALDGLRQQTARLEIILDTVPCGVIIINAPDGHVSFCNRPACELYGRSAEGLEMARHSQSLRLLRPDGTLFPNEELPASQALLHGRICHGVEVIIEQPDGRRITVLASAQPLRDHSGQIDAALAAFVDISDLKKSEALLQTAHDDLEQRVSERTQALAQTIDVLQAEVRQRLAAEAHVREQARMLDAFFVNTQTPLVIMDRDFNFVRVNEAYARSCNRPIEDFPGKNHFDLFPHEENEAIFHQVVQTRTRYQVSAKPFVNPDHPEWGVTWWDWSLTPLLSDGGQVEHLVMTLADVSERIRGEQELKLRAEQLRALAGELTMTEQRERSRLARVLHDHLQQLLVAAKFRAAVVGRSRKTASDLVDIEDLLSQAITASRSLTAELNPPILQEAPLHAAVEWLSNSLAAKHGLQVDVAVDHENLPLAEDVKILLFESVRELLFNVVKHAGVKNAAVSLKRHDGDTLRIVVADDGCGFSPAEVSFSAKSLDGRFGLFSIRERLALVGGRLAIDSAPGKGSRFMLDVPIEALKTPASQANDRPAEQSRTASKRRRRSPAKVRILLADDHVVMRAGLAQLLAQERDLEVVGEASDGLIALDKARRLLPDIVLMDISMPNLNGIQATKAIRRELPDVRVIGLSMFEESERAKAMLDAGADGYATKSGPANELLALIRNVAARSRSLRTTGKASSKPRP